MSRFFIARPILACVVAIITILVGVVALTTMSIEQFPDIAPPQVNVNATYPGASATTLETSVTQVIEQQLTGIDGLLYFSATSSAQGQVQITVVFAKGTNPDIAQVQVQNKVQQAMGRLPQAVQEQGVTVTKSNPDQLLIATIFDTTDRSTNIDVADFMVSRLQDPIGRIPGVGQTTVFGTQYAMRIWLDPNKLAANALMPGDVIQAVASQNVEVAAGVVGGLPSPAGQLLNATITAQSRLTSPEEFARIVVKSTADGASVLLSDVARIELGAESYNVVSRVNRHPGAGMGISLAPGADALITARLVKAEIEKQAKDFPRGFTYAYANDTTAFLEKSVEDVVHTLFEAVVLVVLVIFIFLQSWRATLIPAIAVPVVLLGTFAVLAMVGYSINTLTLFGMVLAIGLLVDDAIVVVENVERLMHENPGMSPREATILSMQEIQGALVAIALVLSAVFLPMAFFGGSTGVIYRQFSVTIVSAMALSVLVALILSPALTSTLLKPREGGEGSGRLARWSLAFHHWFEPRFARLTERYHARLTWTIGRRRGAMLVYGAMVILLGLLFVRLPTGFLPSEDQGFAQLQYTLPAGATLERTRAAQRQIEDYLLGQEGKNIKTLLTVAGAGSGGNASGQNAGRGFMSLINWDDRPGAQRTANAVARRATQALGGYRDLEFYALVPSVVRGLGQSSGFTAELQNSSGMPRDAFLTIRDAVLAEARKDPLLTNVRLSTLPDQPTLRITTDNQKLSALGVSVADANATLAAAWGGRYVNDFVDRGRVKRVYVQADAPFRSRPEDVDLWHVRGNAGQMVPFSAFAAISWNQAPTSLTRFNGIPNFEINGQAAPGSSSGQAMAAIEAIIGKYPGVSLAWAGASFQERLAGGQAWILYVLALLVVFLCLAGLYESWSVPVAVLFVIPLGLLGAILAVSFRGLQNDVYLQIGLVTTMGLAAKNAILMIEFAERSVREGRGAVEAVLDAARIRLRPILMTSSAFIFGVLPLVVATGPGANSRIAIGTSVLGGMVSATLLAVFYIPLGFILVHQQVERWRVWRSRGN
ncbi:efflux RND transporter permease subunit [Rhizorhabdus phycosphaerae]|uniref:efflux RND transporter permease subunit n=1 Tax=Rhizorhabdus phycosphaerae TaxID=2711156 RepID=UPI0013EBF9CE|nr:efflux RND transporter permease subunit [Rhizorhabdus phycosphaerae]